MAKHVYKRLDLLGRAIVNRDGWTSRRGGWFERPTGGRCEQGLEWIGKLAVSAGKAVKVEGGYQLAEPRR